MFRKTINNKMLRLYLGSGCENAISSSKLEVLLGLQSKRALQKLIENERKQGGIICASENGYYLPRDKTELGEYYERATKKARGQLFSLKAMKKCLDEINGQETAGW